MAVNQGQIIPEEVVLEDMEDPEAEDMEDPEVEVQEMIEEVEKDKGIKMGKIATADVVDGNSCKT